MPVDPMQRMRKALVALAALVCATQPPSVFAHPHSPLLAAAGSLSAVVLFVVCVDAYRRGALGRLARGVVFACALVLALGVGPAVFGIALLGTLTFATYDGDRPVFTASLFSVVAILGVAAGRGFDVTVDPAGVLSFVFTLFVLAHLVAALRRSLIERDELHRQLAHRASHDLLTGLPNRALFEERLNAAVARRAAGGEDYAVLMVDLDDFKRINDTLGHLAGDRVLQEAGRRLSGSLRGSDHVARFGGDEFVVLIEDCPEELYAHALAARIEHELARPIELPDGWTEVGASIGVAYNARSAERAMRVADDAMYASKRG